MEANLEMKWRWTSPTRKKRAVHLAYAWIFVWFSILWMIPAIAFGRIYIDVNAPSIPKFNIAVPDFKQMAGDGKHPELSVNLAEVVANDLDLSGYFNIMDKKAFLEGKDKPLRGRDIRFKNWSVIGAELLLKGGYACVGRRVEIELRLFDVFLGRQILGKRALGNLTSYRHLMHRLSNEIILRLTGHQGIALTKLAFVGTATGHREIYVSDYDGHNVKPLTAHKDISMLPRWSPDGKKIAYNSYKDNGAMLYLEDVGSGRVKRLSGRSGLNIGACWAPGGREIALTMSHQGNPDIYVIELASGKLQRVTNHWSIDTEAAWAADGKSLIYTSSRSGKPQIYQQDVKPGARPKRLTYEGNYNASASVSSDGKQVAYVYGEGNVYRIAILDLETGATRILTDGALDESPEFAPNNSMILYASQERNGAVLAAVSTDGRQKQRLAFSDGDVREPSWAAVRY